MSRLTIFAKGNSDLVDSLFACRDAETTWNGLNEALRLRRPDWRVRLRHETITRSDALLAAGGVVPPELGHLTIAEPFGIASQFSAAMFETDADAYVLSVQPDVTVPLVRHRASGHVFHNASLTGWSDEHRRWLRTACEPLPMIEPEQTVENFLGIVGRLRQRTQAPILVYNLSSVIAGETIDCYKNLPESLTTRIKRFNLALVDLSVRSGVIVVDVDRIAARYGAERIKLDSLRLNGVGSRLVAEDVLRILEDHDCFAPRDRAAPHDRGHPLA